MSDKLELDFFLIIIWDFSVSTPANRQILCHLSRVPPLISPFYLVKVYKFSEHHCYLTYPA